MPETGVSLRPVGVSVVVGQAGDHTLTINRPVSTFLAALKAEDPQADASGIGFQVDGSLVSAPTRFSEITVQVSAPAALQDQISKPLLKTERGRIVHNSIRGAKTVRFTHQWR